MHSLPKRKEDVHWGRRGEKRNRKENWKVITTGILKHRPGERKEKRGVSKEDARRGEVVRKTVKKSWGIRAIEGEGDCRR